MNKGRTINRILILDADMVSALTIARSLATRHYVVDVASARESPLAAHSNAVNNHYQYPDPLFAETAFLDWLQQQITTTPYALVIPVTERSLVPLANSRDRFRHTRLAMADEQSLKLVLDKAETFRLAERLGVSTPQSLYVSDIGELPDLVADLSYPVVVKPSHSVSGHGEGYSKHNVSYAHSESSLYQKCAAYLRHTPVILQSYFRGLGAGVELIAKDGEILYVFQHLRLHEVPLTGGGSSFRVSTAVESELLEATTLLIRALRWTGVAMVEFKWNPETREYCLMEINGRFWGSLPLAVAAGADFPAMQAELFLRGELGDYPPYRQGIYCRNLASDLMWHEMVLRSRSNEITQVPPPGTVLRDLGKIFSPRHHFDTQSIKDPLPGLVEIKRLGARYAGRLAEALVERWFTVHQRLLWRNGSVREKLKESKAIMFICYGNINRSPLAERLLVSQLPSPHAVTVRSAGFHQEEERPADPRMVQLAAAHGVDLTHSRSRNVDIDLLASSDIIFVMEKRHYDQLRAMDPRVAGKTFLLGASVAGPSLLNAEIPDPYNKSEAVYQNCFNGVQRAISRLARELSIDHVRD